MTTTESTSEPRRRGAPQGNRNAWKHGERSAAAKAARETNRARLIACLPHSDALHGSLEVVDATYAQLAREAQIAQNSPDKTNNSVAPVAGPEGGGGVGFSSNKTNKSTAPESVRRRGAPKGNKNALKHGMKGAERRAFSADLRRFIRRVDATCALAVAAHGMDRKGVR